MKKKIFAIIMTTMMVAALVGCGKEEKKVDLGHDPETENSVEAAVESVGESVGEIVAETTVTEEVSDTVTEDVSNAVGMTIEEYINYANSLSLVALNFATHTPTDADDGCTAYTYIFEDKTVLVCDGSYNAYPNGVLEYDASIDAMVMKSGDEIIAYFGECVIEESHAVFTTHLADGDYVTYIAVGTDDDSYKSLYDINGNSISLSVYPIADTDGKTINFVTHH